MSSKEIKTLLASIFGDGGISLTRVLCAFVILDIMIVWSIDCLIHFKMQDIGAGVASMGLGALGVKGWQAVSGKPDCKKEE